MVIHESSAQTAPVHYAYELNGRGNTFTNVRLILLGLFLVYFSVPILYVVHEFIRMVGSTIIPGDGYEQLLLITATVFLFAVTSRYFGSLFGQLLFGMVGKSQSTRDVTIVTAILGAAAFGMYLVVHQLWKGEGGFNSWTDGLVLATVLITLFIGLIGTPAALMRRTPVCPSCGIYMQKKKAIRFNRTDEAAVVEALNSGDYSRLRDFAHAENNTPAHEVITVTIWECRRCHQHGFVNAEREQPKDPKKVDLAALPAVDVLCSRPLDAAAITALA